VSTARRLWTTFHAAITLGGTILLAVVELACKAILVLPWLVVCLTVAMFVGSWLFAGPSMTVASFSDPGGAPAGSFGQTIADAFALELQRAEKPVGSRRPGPFP
jgi:hypothetical protein